MSRWSSQQGFTVIEMVISLLIITAIISLVAVRFTGFNSTASLDLAAEEMGSVFRQAQLWALTGQTSSGSRPEGGWGVHLEECSAGACTYFMFADIWPTGTPNYIYDAGSDEKVVDIVIPQTLLIDTLVPDTSGVLDVVYDIPQAAIYLNGLQNDTAAIVTLQHVETGATKIIELDRISGRVNIP